MNDVHTHFIPDAVLQWLKDNRERVNARWDLRETGKAEFLTVNGKWSFELKAFFVNETDYLAEQKRAGVAQSLVSPVPQLFLYDFDKELTHEISVEYNRALADMAERNDSVVALATVPLNDPVLAAEELKRAMSSGLKGAIIGPGCSGKLLTEAEFAPLWEEADSLGAILFIHPLLAEDPRLQSRMMPNLIGVPWETTIAATDILLSGYLDKYPKVKILLAHGGGFLPYQIGRLNKGYEKWNPVSSVLQAPPEEYLKRFWYDSVVWHPDALQYLSGLVGRDRVLPGSDFPFDLCVWPPAGLGDSAYRAFMEG